MIGGDVFVFPVTKDKAQLATQDKLIEVLIDPTSQIEFNKKKGSIPVRMDVDVSSMDACAQKSHTVLGDPANQVEAMELLARRISQAPYKMRSRSTGTPQACPPTPSSRRSSTPCATQTEEQRLALVLGEPTFVGSDSLDDEVVRWRPSRSPHPVSGPPPKNPAPDRTRLPAAFALLPTALVVLIVYIGCMLWTVRLSFTTRLSCLGSTGSVSRSTPLVRQ